MASLGNIWFLAIVTTLSILFTLRRVISWRLIFGYSVPIDVSMTILMVMVFKGTVSGAASAALAGLLLAVALTLGKAALGCERLALRRCGRFPWQVRWVVYKHDEGSAARAIRAAGKWFQGHKVSMQQRMAQ